jgi:hypothetical protein
MKRTIWFFNYHNTVHSIVLDRSLGLPHQNALIRLQLEAHTHGQRCPVRAQQPEHLRRLRNAEFQRTFAGLHFVYCLFGLGDAEVRYCLRTEEKEDKTEVKEYAQYQSM